MEVAVRSFIFLSVITGTFASGSFGFDFQQPYSESVSYTPRVLPTPKPGSKLEKRLGPIGPAPAEATSPTPAASERLSIPISVLDTAGNFVTDLKPSAFTLFVEDNPVKIESVELISEPYDVILIIDSKGWSAYSLKQMQDGAIAIVNSLPSTSRVAVMTFTKEHKLIAPLTSDRKELEKAIRNLRRNGKDSALFDTVRVAFDSALATLGKRRAVVLLTDGYDNASSQATYAESLLAVETKDAIVFPVYLDNFEKNLRSTTPASRFMALGISGGIASERVMSVDDQELLEWRYQIGSLYVNDLVLMTGGRAMYLGDVLLDPKSGRHAIGRQLRSQYSLTFNLNRTGRQRLRVRVNRPNLAVLTKGSLLASTAK